MSLPAPGDRILILGGTGEARELADALVARGHRVTTSFAGVTRSPRKPTGEIRTGGFGGVEGLASYLVENRTRLLIDATHPFAQTMSRHAVEASRSVGIGCLRLERPEWRAEPGDRWTLVESASEAAQALPRSAQVLLTIGRKELEPFLDRTDLSGLLRMIEPPDFRVPERWSILLARPPFTLESEHLLMVTDRITALVSKNSGGETEAKLLAARELQVPVFMIARPPKPPAPSAPTVGATVALVERTLKGSS